MSLFSDIGWAHSVINTKSTDEEGRDEPCPQPAHLPKVSNCTPSERQHCQDDPCASWIIGIVASRPHRVASGVVDSEVWTKKN